MYQKIPIVFLFVIPLLLMHPCFGMKYTYLIFQPCEKCEENSKIFYEMENMQLCARCSLGYLSFHFSDQDHKAIKFYITDIIFNYLNDQQWTWNEINVLVQKKLKKAWTILQNRKKAKEKLRLIFVYE